MAKRLLLVLGGTAIVLLGTGAGHAQRASAGAPARWLIHNLGTLPAPFSHASEADRIDDRGRILGWSSGGGNRNRGVVWNGRVRAVLGGSSFVQLAGMNANGDVVGAGSVTHDARFHLFLWRRDRTRVDLTAQAGLRGDVRAINDKREIVGQMQTASRHTHAFLWRNGAVTDLGTLGGNDSYATAINGRGQIVGASETASGSTHAFLWQKGRLTDLGTLPGEESVPTSINDGGQIVGYAHVGYLDPDHVLLWANRKLKVLAGFGPGGLSPVEITNHGVVLVDSINPERAFLWRAGKVVDLGSLGGGATHAYDVNERGQVVGSSKVAAVHRAAFFWSNGKMTRLPALAPGGGPPYTIATAINDRGEIVGGSYVGRIGRERAVLWTLRR
jgi:probable HAF family extracellular repeat protein